MKHAHQPGFTLIELAVVVTIASALMVTITMAMNVHYKRMQTQLVGKQYQLVNAAVGDYMGVHYQALSALPADCAQLDLALGTSLPVVDSIRNGDCRLSLPVAGSTVTVNNGLQPSLPELRALRLLDRITSSELMLPTRNAVATSASGESSRDLAPSGFAVQVSKECPTTACTEGVQLSSLVFNTQPYVLGGEHLRRFGFDLVEELLMAAGADAAFSHPVPTGASSELRGSQDLYVHANPIRDYSLSKSASAGVPGILAIRNGHGSTTLAQFARRDGASKVTGSWDFDGHPIVGLSSLSSSGVSSVTSRTTSLSVTGAAQVHTLQAQTVSAGKLKLPAVTAHEACDPALESMGVSALEGLLLMCSVANRQWTAYAP
jgi:prepilin-type N-terminal cleavage/methylation domain-containing protein